jgi:hypothetical protein
MAVYLVSGRLGSGKTLACVGRIRDTLLAGRRVATNLDLNLEKLLPARAKKVDCQRLPDKPTVADLDAIGLGTPLPDESRNGLIVLDELGSWLNSREWADKGRQKVIDWLIHSRKKGWDVIFIVQHISMIDKQVRDALVEYLVVCRRLDRMKIPLLGGVINTISGGLISGHLPRVHLGIVRYGTSHDAPVSDRWVYTGTDLYAAYDTRQVFTSTYAHGTFTYLPPWHTTGRYATPKRLWLAPAPKPLPKPKLQLVARIQRLPVERRLEFYRRFQACGAI